MTGLRQGDALHPILFNIELVHKTLLGIKHSDQKSIKLVAYINDIVMLEIQKKMYT